MSGQIKLKSASLGGDITLAPTDTASNLVVTIPAVTATLLNNLSDIEAQVKTATSATGDAPIFSCRAFVNFNGTGTVAIRASGNVSSITDNGVGLYTVNFTTAMPDGNYSVAISLDSGGSTTAFTQVGGFDRAANNQTTSFRINTHSGGFSLTDYPIINASVFR